MKVGAMQDQNYWKVFGGRHYNMDDALFKGFLKEYMLEQTISEGSEDK
jgi:hypothetical protein